MCVYLWIQPGDENQTEESITSSEFERFLAERAAAAEALPNVGTGNTTQPSTRTQRPTKDDESGLFAL